MVAWQTYGSPASITLSLPSSCVFEVIDGHFDFNQCCVVCRHYSCSPPRKRPLMNEASHYSLDFNILSAVQSPFYS